MKKLSIFFLLILFLVSCGERNPNSPFADENIGYDGNTPSSSKIEIFPDNVGSYWVYNNFQLDEKNARVKESLSTDSVVIVDEITKAGKKAKKFTTYNKTLSNYKKVKDDFYYKSGKQVLSLESWLENFMGELPIPIISFSDTAWVKVLDAEDDLWRVYRRKLDESGMPVTGDVDILASWEGTESIKVAGKTYLAQAYLFTLEVDVAITIPGLGVQNIHIQRELFNYYVKNIGLVKSLMTSTSINIPILGEYPMNGFDKEIIRYNIK